MDVWFSFESTDCFVRFEKNHNFHSINLLYKKNIIALVKFALTPSTQMRHRKNHTTHTQSETSAVSVTTPSANIYLFSRQKFACDVIISHPHTHTHAHWLTYVILLYVSMVILIIECLHLSTFTTTKLWLQCLPHHLRFVSNSQMCVKLQNELLIYQTTHQPQTSVTFYGQHHLIVFCLNKIVFEKILKNTNKQQVVSANYILKPNAAVSSQHLNSVKSTIYIWWHSCCRRGSPTPPGLYDIS